jgi:hypothetical protein
MEFPQLDRGGSQPVTRGCPAFRRPLGGGLGAGWHPEWPRKHGLDNRTGSGYDSRMRRVLCVLPVVGLFSGCLMERTVTDSQGNVIYQEPEIHTPFESEAKKQREIEAKERELGWE